MPEVQSSAIDDPRLPTISTGTATVQSPLPVSSMKTEVLEIPQFGMWVGFLYIIYFIALYVWATSFGNILHEIVNRYVKDALELEEARRSFFGFWGTEYVIKWSLAALVIFYPVFVFVHLLTVRLVNNRPETINIRVRKILIYITLIGTFLISSYQLVKFVYSFLDGTITFKTFVHFGVTLGIAGIIFIYYFFQVRKDKNS